MERNEIKKELNRLRRLYDREYLANSPEGRECYKSILALERKLKSKINRKPFDNNR